MMFCLLLASFFTFVELNCENLFDVSHDSLKNDVEFLPESNYHWTPYRYWNKINRIGQDVMSCGGSGHEWMLPDMVALCEVENDSVMRDLTKRSLLRTARYEYVMTDSPDERGIDVALMYSPFSFSLINSHSIRINPITGMRPTRDVLYASGKMISGDTLHVFVVHAPSRRGGEHASRKYRLHVAARLAEAVDSVREISPKAKIVVAGDFNDYTNDASIKLLRAHGLIDISAGAHGDNGAMGTYRFHGEWGSLDHILVSSSFAASFSECKINDSSFLTVEDEKYGGTKPKRNYQGPKYLDGFSDHLPLVAKFTIKTECEY